MRVLFISNFYPPIYLGGMELRCQEVVDGLRARGHQCLVLTSRFALSGKSTALQPDVRRVFASDADVYHYRPVDYLVRYPFEVRRNVAELHTAIHEFGPDLVFIWGMWNLSPAVAGAAEEALPGRVAYSFAGYWPIEPDAHEGFWHNPTGSWLGRRACSALAPLALSSLYRPVRPRRLRVRYAITCSEFVLRRLRSAGMELPNARVILSGIELAAFRRPAGEPRRPTGGLRVLVAGNVTTHKGAHVAVEAMERLGGRCDAGVRLTIVGDGHPDYEARLRRMVAASGLESRVAFRPGVPRKDMPALLSEFDVMVLPTLTEEPLSRMVMESMAHGLVVIAANTGGTPEMVCDGVDGLLFDPGDAEALAGRLCQVALDPQLSVRLGQEAQRTAEARFDRDRMVVEIESFLAGILAGQLE